MKLQGKLADVSIDYSTHKPKLTFLINKSAYNRYLYRIVYKYLYGLKIVKPQDDY